MPTKTVKRTGGQITHVKRGNKFLTIQEAVIYDRKKAKMMEGSVEPESDEKP